MLYSFVANLIDYDRILIPESPNSLLPI